MKKLCGALRGGIFVFCAAVGLVGAAAPRHADEPQAPDFATTTDDITEHDLQQHLYWLASPELEGRLTGTRGERLATQYVADVFGALGLQPAGEKGGWFDEFSFTAGVQLGAGNGMAIVREGADPRVLAVNTDFRPLAFSKVGRIDPAEVVFAGYGLAAPKTDTLPEYNSYADLAVEGKWVMMFRFVPEGVSPEMRRNLLPYADLKRKASVARGFGAKGIIIVSGPNSRVNAELVSLEFDAAMTGLSIGAVSVADAVATELLEGSGQTLKGLQDRLDTGEMVAGFVVAGQKVSLDVDILQETKVGRNVIGRLVVGDAPSESVIMVTAHVDHLGIKTGGENPGINYGADDNGSGSVAMLEIAQWIVAQHRSGRLNVKRDIVFAAWSGEELGLLGSSHYVSSLVTDPTAPVYPRIGACLNLDMVGRLRETLIMQGTGSSSIWKDEVQRVAGVEGMTVSLQEDPYLPTDSTAFYLRGVPTLNAFTGSHDDYHTPRDTPDKINYEGLKKVAVFMAQVAEDVAARDALPDYLLVPRQGGGTGFRAYLGTIPDFSGENVVGVLLAGVRAGSPADRGGLKAGDVIVELAGTKIENLYDYSYALAALRIGEPVPIAIMRGTERLVFYVTPESRQ